MTPSTYPRSARLAAIAGVPQASVLGVLPWTSILLSQEKKATPMEKTATDPVAFLEECIRRYDRDVKGYSCIMQKQERTKGKLHPTEVMQVYFKEKPHSVFLEWQKGERRAKRVLSVAGENDEQMLIGPTGPAGG